MDIITIFGLVGSVASVIGLLIAAPTIRSRVIHVAYAIFISALGVWLVNYQNRVSLAERQIAEMQDIERGAEKLLSDFDFSTSGSMAGFELAALSFLEKHKDRLPDTYKRAEELCGNAGCLTTKNDSYGPTMEHFNNMQDASTAMKYLIQGIAKNGA